MQYVGIDWAYRRAAWCVGARKAAPPPEIKRGRGHRPVPESLRVDEELARLAPLVHRWTPTSSTAHGLMGGCSAVTARVLRPGVDRAVEVVMAQVPRLLREDQVNRTWRTARCRPPPAEPTSHVGCDAASHTACCARTSPESRRRPLRVAVVADALEDLLEKRWRLPPRLLELTTALIAGRHPTITLARAPLGALLLLPAALGSPVARGAPARQPDPSAPLYWEHPLFQRLLTLWAQLRHSGHSARRSP
jgi:hypothetical protein